MGRLALGVDIREYGDGNPGATNVFRAGGKWWGGFALAIDILKAAVPVGLATWLWGWSGVELILLTVASVAGHAFSPFFGFKGGKAVATSLGMWIGITLWEVPLVGVLMLLYWRKSSESDAWALMFALLSIVVYLFIRQAPTIYLMIWLLNSSLLAWKHRADLRQTPGVKIWLPFKRYQHLAS